MASMTPRERVLRALAHREPDRVPHNLRPSDEMRERLRREQGDPNVDFAAFFGHDVRYVSVPLPECPDSVPRHEWVPLPTADDDRDFTIKP